MASHNASWLLQHPTMHHGLSELSTPGVLQARLRWGLSVPPRRRPSSPCLQPSGLVVPGLPVPAGDGVAWKSPSHCPSTIKAPASPPLPLASFPDAPQPLPDSNSDCPVGAAAAPWGAKKSFQGCCRMPCTPGTIRHLRLTQRFPTGMLRVRNVWACCSLPQFFAT